MSDCESGRNSMFFIALVDDVPMSESSSGWSSVLDGRQSVMLVLKGLCSSVSRAGALERMVTMCAVSSLVRVGVLGGVAGGWDVVLYVERWRRSTDLFRSVVMSLLTVLGKSLLRCLWVGRE